MKKYRYIILASIIMSIYILTSGNIGCNPPTQPPDDTLLDPPPPPVLSGPADGSEYCVDFVFPDTYMLQWNGVEDAESYQVQISRDSVFSSGPIVSVPALTYAYVVDTGRAIEHYYWHVRAASDKWKGVTQWSETWGFTIFYPE